MQKTIPAVMQHHVGLMLGADECELRSDSGLRNADQPPGPDHIPLLVVRVFDGQKIGASMFIRQRRQPLAQLTFQPRDPIAVNARNPCRCVVL
ncbi:hypothetical protein D3C84_1070190 [compost metagenome]